MNRVALTADGGANPDLSLPWTRVVARGVQPQAAPNQELIELLIN